MIDINIEMIIGKIAIVQNAMNEMQEVNQYIISAEELERYNNHLTTSIRILSSMMNRGESF